MVPLLVFPSLVVTSTLEISEFWRFCLLCSNAIVQTYHIGWQECPDARSDFSLDLFLSEWEKALIRRWICWTGVRHHQQSSSWVAILLGIGELEWGVRSCVSQTKDWKVSVIWDQVWSEVYSRQKWSSTLLLPLQSSSFDVNPQSSPYLFLARPLSFMFFFLWLWV